MSKSDLVVVTGCFGFLAEHLGRHLNRQGYTNVKGVDSFQRDLGSISSVTYWDLAESSPDGMIAIDANTTVVHLAAAPWVGATVEDRLKVNVWATANVARWAAKYSARVILASTVQVYGAAGTEPVVDEETEPRPTGEYGISKLLAESALPMLLEKQRYVVLRFSNMVGSGQKVGAVLPDFVKQALDRDDAMRPTNWPFRIRGTGQEYRDFLWVEDAARAVEAVIEDWPQTTPYHGQRVFNVSSGISMTTRELAALVLRELGQPLTPIETDGVAGPQDAGAKPRPRIWSPGRFVERYDWLPTSPAVFLPASVRALVTEMSPRVVSREI